MAQNYVDCGRQFVHGYRLRGADGHQLAGHRAGIYAGRYVKRNADDSVHSVVHGRAVQPANAGAVLSVVRDGRGAGADRSAVIGVAVGGAGRLRGPLADGGGAGTGSGWRILVVRATATYFMISLLFIGFLPEHLIS